MNSTLTAETQDIVSSARVPSQQERSAMLELVTKHDGAKQVQDYDALIGTFHRSAICEFKPAGLRMTSLDTIGEMYRRTLPILSPSFLMRCKLREWSNQNGLLREWVYPVKLPSGEEQRTKQLEIFEFAEGLQSIKSYRVRMNGIYSALFLEALGKDFPSLRGVEKVPG